MKLNKNGNTMLIFLSLFFVILFILMMCIYISYLQINVMVYPIKQDIFYIAQNSFLSLNKESLKYFEYDVNNEEFVNKITELVNLNYKDRVIINNIQYNKYTNYVKIDYQIFFSPVVFKNALGERVSISISDNIKLKSMEVK